MSERIHRRGRTPFFLAAALLMGLTACDSSPEADETGPDGGTVEDGGTGVDGGSDERKARLEFLDIYPAVAVSSDGTTAVIADQMSGTNDVYVYDVATGALERKTETGAERYTNGMSGDGRRIIGSRGTPEQAAIWSEASGWIDLGSPFPRGCDGLGSGWDLNEDGSVAVGMLWKDNCDVAAFRWTDASGEGVLTPLAELGPVNRATVLSADGKVAAGFARMEGIADRSPAVWREDGTGFFLDEEETLHYGEIMGINEDGSMVTGVWGQEGFYWTKETGVVNIGSLPNPAGENLTLASTIAAGGKLIFGGSGHRVFSVQRAFVWTAEHGMRPLEDIARANGLVMRDGFILSHVMSASADGEVVVGFASNPLTQEWISFVLELPISAYGL